MAFSWIYKVYEGPLSDLCLQLQCLDTELSLPSVKSVPFPAKRYLNQGPNQGSARDKKKSVPGSSWFPNFRIEAGSRFPLVPQFSNHGRFPVPTWFPNFWTMSGSRFPLVPLFWTKAGSRFPDFWTKAGSRFPLVPLFLTKAGSQFPPGLFSVS